jgi:uncharacterized protein (UPF0264 family)
VRPSLLISVRNALEAKTALENGAGLIDVKEPENGALGKASAQAIGEVVAAMAGRAPVSAALGEMIEGSPADMIAGLSYAKWGLAGCGTQAGWRGELARAGAGLTTSNPTCLPVAVAYADWQRARAPRPGEVFIFARDHGWNVLLVDTWEKDGTTLRDWMSLEEIARLREATRKEGVRLALAGSLGRADLEALLPVRPEWFAVRGAVCRNGNRRAGIDGKAVRVFAVLLLGCSPSPKPSEPAIREN